MLFFFILAIRTMVMAMVTRMRMVMMTIGRCMVASMKMVMMVTMMTMMTVWMCMVTRMKMVTYIMMIMMMMMTIGRRMVATGSGGQEMEQLKLINQPLIYWMGRPGLGKVFKPDLQMQISQGNRRVLKILGNSTKKTFFLLY